MYQCGKHGWCNADKSVHQTATAALHPRMDSSSARNLYQLPYRHQHRRMDCASVSICRDNDSTPWWVRGHSTWLAWCPCRLLCAYHLPAVTASWSALLFDKYLLIYLEQTIELSTWFIIFPAWPLLQAVGWLYEVLMDFFGGIEDTLSSFQKASCNRRDLIKATDSYWVGLLLVGCDLKRQSVGLPGTPKTKWY